MKTNKCSVQFFCHGNGITCDFAINNPCKYLNEGLCTCKEAIIDTLDKEGYSTEIISGRARFDKEVGNE